MSFLCPNPDCGVMLEPGWKICQICDTHLDSTKRPETIVEHLETDNTVDEAFDFIEFDPSPVVLKKSPPPSKKPDQYRNKNSSPKISTREMAAYELCGAAVVISKDSTVAHPIYNKVVVIGRDSECDITINDGSISNFHADLIMKRNMYYDRSRNGSKVNGEIVHEDMVDVYNGTTIEIGDHKIILYLAP